jgi:hypothetical protein
MKILDRIRLPWPRWLVGAVSASAGLLVIGYQLACQIALDSTRPLGLFWLETVAFSVVGPVVAWFLLRQLARGV